MNIFNPVMWWAH